MAAQAAHRGKLPQTVRMYQSSPSNGKDKHNAEKPRTIYEEKAESEESSPTRHQVTQQNRSIQSHHVAPRSHPQRQSSSSVRKPQSVSRRYPATRVYGRGYNIQYQFGVDSNDNYSSDMIELKWCRGLNISYICSGISHSLYLSFAGDYYFCGQIDAEKLGLNQQSSPHSHSNAKPRKVIRFCRESMSTFCDSPLKVSRIADGVASRHMIVISSDRCAYSMGANHRGQLGLGHYKSTLKFAKIEFAVSSQDIADHVGFEVIDASAGESHSAFVLKPKCTLPIAAILNYFCLVHRLRMLEGSFNIILGVVSRFLIRSNSLLTEPRGRLYVVGCNNFGQLGLGPSTQGSSGPTSINRPVQVIAGGLSAVSIAQVSCGENHTVCLDNRGRVYCFGDNYYGQSGCHLNHYENVHYPMKVEHFKKQYGARIVKVSSGKYHVVALDNRGRVFCWGLGAYGQLGCNKLNKRIILPVLVGDGLVDKKVMDVRAGMYHTICLDDRGRLFCWGSNNYGQCFQSQNTETIITPKMAKISADKKIYKAFCGYYSTMVLTYDS